MEGNRYRKDKTSLIVVFLFFVIYVVFSRFSFYLFKINGQPILNEFYGQIIFKEYHIEFAIK